MSTDIGMEFGLSKCKCINIVNGKYQKMGGIKLLSGGVMEELNADESYKYLGIEELEVIKHADIKNKISKNFKSKLRKLLETELNARNLFQAINECILPLISYSFGVVQWTEDELKSYDILARKMLHMYRAFERNSDIDRLYLPREKGGRGLISVWDTFQSTTCRIAHAFKHTNNPILNQCLAVEQNCLFSNISRADKYENQLNIGLPGNFYEKSIMAQARIKAKLVKDSLNRDHADKYLAKPQHGAFARLLNDNEADVKQSFAWLKKCHLDPHTESYICGAQELAVITKVHEKRILKNSSDDLCRVCKKDPESIFHILGACDVLAKREYFTRHNNICKYLHYKIMNHYQVKTGDNWFHHEPDDVVLNDKCEIIYDQVIATTRPVGANRPDIIVKDKTTKKALIIDVSCPVDTNIGKKEREKVGKYAGLKGELQRMWGMKAEIVPIIVGGLGAITKNLGDELTKVPGHPDRFMCQKICLLGSKKILQDVLKRR